MAALSAASGVSESEGRFGGVRDLSLFWRAWRPSEPRVRVILVHGYGEHSGRYQHLAQRLAVGGVTVVAPDHRGHGRSQGRPVSVVTFDDYVEDLQRLLHLVRAGPGGDLPTVMLGHSMGGLIALAYALTHEDELAGLILSAPAVLPPGDVSQLTIRAGRLLARVAPNAGTVALRLDLLCRDPAVIDAYRADPLVHRRRIPARLGAEMLRVMSDAAEHMARIHLPVLLLQGTDDGIVEPAAARFVHDGIGSADRTLHEYPGLYHEVFNEPEREQVIGEVVRWLSARFPVGAGSDG